MRRLQTVAPGDRRGGPDRLSGGANAEDPLQKLKYDPYYTAAAYARGRGRANLAAFLLFYAGMVFSIS
jgi:hypothetical protein